MDEYRPKVGLVLKVDLPPEWIAEFEALTALPRSDIAIRQIYSGPAAGAFLYLPQAVGLFLASAYFASLATELGKDHYLHIKRAAKRLWARSRGLQVTVIGSRKQSKRSRRFPISLFHHRGNYGRKKF